MYTFSNEKGSLSLAILLIVISLVSCLSLALISQTDNAESKRSLQNAQEHVLLRSELERCFTVVNNSGLNTSLSLPSRRITVKGLNYNHTYRTDSSILVNKVLGDEILSFKIKSGVGKSKTQFINHDKIINRHRHAELSRLSFASIHYFTDKEMSVNNSYTRFWGNDVVFGSIHTNHDLVIQDGGNNEYNGPWPCFFGKVSIGGNINWLTGAGPEDQIFRNVYHENVAPIELPTIAENIRTYGTTISPTGDILYVRSLGSSTVGYLGTIVTGSIDSLINLVVEPDVWTDYEGVQWPYEFVKDRTAVNRMTRKDTTWSAFATSCPSGSSIMIDGPQLWLEGQFAGAQTWACSDTLFLAGSILLDGTAMGDSPDDPLTYNRNDYVGIVSEKNIVIKYGMPDLMENPNEYGYYPRRHPNSNDIYIYAALCALGDGGGNPNYDGVFTFEYQHPHFSTHPSVIYQLLGGRPTIYDPEMDTVFTEQQIPYPDLVGMSYIPALGYQPTGYGSIIPYNGNTANNTWSAYWDYPFYNPLYPEGPDDINQYAGERGTIFLYGSVAQRRKGFMHRSNYQNENLTQNIWMFNDESITDIAQYGSDTPLSGIGYETQYYNDIRLTSVQPPHFPFTDRFIITNYNEYSILNNSDEAGY